MCIDATDAVTCSAKTGVGIEDVLETIVKNIPAPQGSYTEPLQALIVDSWFDNYQGVVSLVRIMNGEVKKGDKMLVMSTGQVHQIDNVGIFTPKQTETGILRAGEVGYIIAGIKEIHGAPVGDTITINKKETDKALAGFQKAQPQVYAGIFPISSDDYENFRDALNKLSLNDASLFFEPEKFICIRFWFSYRLSWNATYGNRTRTFST